MVELSNDNDTFTSNFRQIPLSCRGHTRPVVDLAFSDVTDCGYFLISACKGEQFVMLTYCISVI